MGITGLIGFLEKATRKVTVKDLKGSTVGIDTYCWLHKGAISCAEKLIRGDPTGKRNALCIMFPVSNPLFPYPVADLHIQYCLKYVNLLLSNGIKPVLVFDGRHLPAKALTERRRGASRREAKEKAKELLREGKVNEARSYINRSVNITHNMAHQLIQECRKRNVDYIVAPYEADGQLGFLSRRKIVDYVITEDSDLTLFGCDRVIWKFDLSGQGLLFEAEHLHMAMGCKPEKFEFRRFEMMAILSGCDYLDSLRGIGLGKACKFVMMTEETDMQRCLKKIPQYLNLKGVTVDQEYVEGFLRAVFTFRHMIVYDPTTRKQVHLTEPPEEVLPYCDNAGEKMQDEETAFQMAIGNVNPFTMKQMDTWDPSELNTDKYPSIWGRCGGGGGGGAGAKKGSSNLVITINKSDLVSNGVGKRKMIHKPVDMDDESEHAMNTSVDIMNKYLDNPKMDDQSTINIIADSPPEAKKFRLSTEGDRVNRNPFLMKKKILDSEEEGPASEGDEKNKHFSLLKQANAMKTESKSSKFKTSTAMSKKVSVVSRFFSPGGGPSDKKETHLEAEERKNDEYPRESPAKVQKEMVREIAPEAGHSKGSKPSESDPDSEGLMDCSAFVETQFSDSEMQRENEQSPIPWQDPSAHENIVQATLTSSQVSSSDKENDQDINNNHDDTLCILLSDDDPTPKKRKSPSSAKKRNKLPLKKSKQPTMMTFFQKKGRQIV